MKNNIISLVLFVLLIGLVFFARGRLIHLCDHIETSCDSIEMALDNKDYDKAYDESVKLLNILETDTAFHAMYISNTDIENLINNCTSIAIYSKLKNDSDASVALHILRLSSRSIRNLQEPTLENIL